MDTGDETRQETAKSARRYVTTACDPCRESKVKCDAKRPHCSQCQKKSRICVYAEKGDKRKVSLRATVELLSKRVNDLTSILVQHGIQVPGMGQNDEALLESVLRTLELPLPALHHSLGADIEVSSTTMSNQYGELTASGEVDNSALINALGSENFTTATTEAVYATTSLGRVVSCGTKYEPYLYEADEQALVSGGRLAFPDSSSPEWPWFALDPTLAIDFALNGMDRFDFQQTTIENHTELQFDSAAVEEDETIAEPSEDEADDGLVSQLSARVGSLRLAPDGQLRFFGAATNIHFLEEQMRFHASTDVRSVHEEGQYLLEHAGVHKPVETSFLNHLLKLYFQWHEPCLPLVNRVSFEQARQQFESGADNTGYCSGVLMNAMCAIGAAFEAKFHPTFITFPKSLAEFFAERAKVLLEIELDSPCVATMQGLILLSNHEASVNRDARGWLYSGMAMRLAFDLGLHVDCTSYVQQRRMSLEEAEARRTAFWGSFVVNHLYSFYTGRPFQVDDKEITVARPDRHEVIGSNSSLRNLCRSDSAEHDGDSAGMLVFLCETVAPHAHVLYGQSHTNEDELQASSQDITTRLTAWKANLPLELQVDLNNPSRSYRPHVVVLNMLYHYLQIMLHRPYTSRILQPNPPRGPGYGHARKTCIESAIAISMLLRIYEAQHTFRRANVHMVHVIFSSALILIFAMLFGTGTEKHDYNSFGWGDESTTTAAHLSACFRALDEISHVVERAKSVREHLSAIQNRWSQEKRKYNSSKRKLQLRQDTPRKKVFKSQRA